MEHKLSDFTTFHNVINNELKPTTTTRHSLDPSTEEPMPESPLSTQQDVDAAVAAAKAAFPAWRDLSFEQRASYLLKLADALEAQADDFRDLLSREAGKGLQTAAMEIALTVAHLRGTAKLRLPDEPAWPPEDTEERSARVRYRPVGVGCAIVPWNWPHLITAGKYGPGILAGNCVIVKPSPYAPYSLLKLGELAAKIMPPGVLQVLSGDDNLGPMLTEHPGIGKISFTGSTATGKKVMESCSRTLKRVTLELGGNDAAVVCDDADLAVVVPKVSTLAFLNSGEICMSIKRVYVQDKLYDAFLAAMAAFVRDNMPAGPTSDPATMIGPVQNKVQYEKVKDIFADSDKQGFKTALGCTKISDDGQKGFLIPPTIIDNPPDESRVVAEEAFGPILPVMRWTTEDEVIRRVNDTEFGLGASVWSSDIPRAERMADKLETGSVWVNTHFEVGPQMPFGGHKSSGIGMDWGIVGLKGWCNPQAVWVRKRP